jgi:Flp pilus assembly protein TadG
MKRAKMRLSSGRAPRILGSLFTSRRGNVTILFAFAAVALIIAIGMGIDMWRAYAVKARLQSAVDAAALAIASTDQANFTKAELKTRAQAFFTANYPASALGTPGKAKLTFGTTDNIINITATATVPTTFMQIAKVKSLSMSATGQATASSPNIDFYLLLDDSPSMGIAATQADINTMIANTTTQCDPATRQPNACGCAFACHQVTQVNDTHCSTQEIANNTDCTLSGLGNPNGEDNLALARALGVTLRIDMLNQATGNLMKTAQTTAAVNQAQYRVAIYTFDIAVNTIQALTSNLTTAETSAGSISQLEVYAQNEVTSTDNNADAATNYDNAIDTLNTTMPAPGNGTNAAGDTPKEVLFFVTDGVEDEYVGGNRVESVMSPTMCNTIKARGITIAVLYTTYYPLDTPTSYNSWYSHNVESFQPNIASALQQCASPNLFFQVDTGQDISTAMSALFVNAVNSVFLSK